MLTNMLYHDCTIYYVITYVNRVTANINKIIEHQCTFYGTVICCMLDINDVKLTIAYVAAQLWCMTYDTKFPYHGYSA